MNLVIALLGTRQYVTAARIRATVPGYEADDGSERADEAFKRMFERDKAELREMGVPLETGRTSAFDTEDGYRIARADYELPEITLTGEEAAAVGLALRLWESAQLAGAAQSALVKLRAAGVDVDPHAPSRSSRGSTPGSRPSSPATPRPATAGELEFDYRRPEEDTPARRHVQPWGVVAWHGRWYLVGLDLDRQAPRVFRLSRVVGTPDVTGPEGAFEPPADVDLAAIVARQAAGEEHLVIVRARPGDGGRPAPAAGPARRRRTTATTGCSCAPPSRGRWPTSSPPTAPTCVVEAPDRGARGRRRAADPARRDGRSAA